MRPGRCPATDVSLRETFARPESCVIYTGLVPYTSEPLWREQTFPREVPVRLELGLSPDIWAPGEGVSIWDERAVHERHLSQSSVAKWWENGYCARHSASCNTVVRDSQLSTDLLTQPLSPFVPKHKAREGKGMLQTDIKLLIILAIYGAYRPALTPMRFIKTARRLRADTRTGSSRALSRRGGMIG
jgi:hypothetical protein